MALGVERHAGLPASGRSPRSCSRSSPSAAAGRPGSLLVVSAVDDRPAQPAEHPQRRSRRCRCCSPARPSSCCSPAAPTTGTPDGTADAAGRRLARRRPGLGPLQPAGYGHGLRPAGYGSRATARATATATASRATASRATASRATASRATASRATASRATASRATASSRLRPARARQHGPAGTTTPATGPAAGPGLAPRRDRPGPAAPREASPADGDQPTEGDRRTERHGAGARRGPARASGAAGPAGQPGQPEPAAAGLAAAAAVAAPAGGAAAAAAAAQALVTRPRPGAARRSGRPCRAARGLLERRSAACRTPTAPGAGRRRGRRRTPARGSRRRRPARAAPGRTPPVGPAEVADVAEREVGALRHHRVEPEVGQPGAEQVAAYGEVGGQLGDRRRPRGPARGRPPAAAARRW